MLSRAISGLLLVAGLQDWKDESKPHLTEIFDLSRRADLVTGLQVRKRCIERTVISDAMLDAVLPLPQNDRVVRSRKEKRNAAEKKAEDERRDFNWRLLQDHNKSLGLPPGFGPDYLREFFKKGASKADRLLQLPAFISAALHLHSCDPHRDYGGKRCDDVLDTDRKQISEAAEHMNGTPLDLGNRTYGITLETLLWRIGLGAKVQGADAHQWEADRKRLLFKQQHFGDITRKLCPDGATRYWATCMYPAT